MGVVSTPLSSARREPTRANPSIFVRARSGAEVLHVLGCRSVQWGSFEDYLLGVVAHCRSRGLRLVLVYPELPVSEAYRDAVIGCGGEIETVPGTDRVGAGCLVGLRRVIARRQPSIVHANFGRVGYLTVLLSRASGVPHVYLTKHQMSERRPSRRHARVFSIMQWATDAILCVSAGVRTQLTELGLDGDRLAVMPHGVDVGRFRPDPLVRHETRRLLGLDPSQPAVLCVSHLRAGKGLEFLLQAMCDVVTERPNAVLLLAGDGPMRERLQEMAAALRIGGRARFLGMRHDIPGLLMASDVVACPSLSEGAGSSVLEAMSSARPVVATPVGYAAELIRDGVNGWLVAPADAGALGRTIRAALADRDRLADVGGAARETVASLARVDQTAERLAECYAAAVSGSGGA